MYEENRFKVGLFVILGVSLIIGFVFFLGLKTALEPKLNFYTKFNESVQGLEVGSPVKFKGVTIGNVSKIMIGKEQKRIRVDMEINPTTIDYDPDTVKDDTIKNMITEEIAKGLCCQLQMTGITGMKYIEIDYFPDQLHTDQFSTFDDYYIPPGTSVFQSTVDSISVALEKISKVDFDTIGKELQETVKSVNRIAGSDDIKKLMKAVADTSEEVKLIAQKVRKLVESEHFPNAIEQIDKTLESISTLSREIQKQIKSADIKGVSVEIKSTLEEVQSTGKSTRSSIDKSLKELNKALYEVKELAKSLEHDPSSVIHGSQQKDRFAE